MKLYYSSTSPYARKTLICAHELNLINKIDLITTSPFTDEDYRAINPLAKIPALESEDMGIIYDSSVICEYLCQLAGNEKILPAAGKPRIKILRLHALAQGMTDCALNIKQNIMRSEGEDSPTMPEDWYIERQYSAIAAGMDEATIELDDFKDHVNMGSIAMACFLEYWNFRFSDNIWQGDYPELANWLENFAKRDAMIATKPV